MNKQVLIVAASILALSCTENVDKKNTDDKATVTDTAAAKNTTTNSNADSNNQKPLLDVVKDSSAVKLALTSNALQLINAKTGSTRQLDFGLAQQEVIDIVSKVLNLKVLNIGVNSECGAGALKMATWANGLTLLFQEEKTQSSWLFVGWSLADAKEKALRPTTMAGIGIGSSRSEMENTYVIKVAKSSLGYEFSTDTGLYGIFDNNTNAAKITAMWSGVNCVFR